jgi:hypothetical protein
MLTSSSDSGFETGRERAVVGGKIKNFCLFVQPSLFPSLPSSLPPFLSPRRNERYRSGGVGLRE